MRLGLEILLVFQHNNISYLYVAYTLANKYLVTLTHYIRYPFATFRQGLSDVSAIEWSRLCVHMAGCWFVPKN